MKRGVVGIYIIKNNDDGIERNYKTIGRIRLEI